ncbi:hypothetical protein MMO38_06610 [Acinetobacter sp. NIPH 1852]|uniref:hypothetical protein n=1 Tax=Acinetobacter sp. NIPH 1852 TaxID=2923428 RepID=UPI001F4B3CE5|nr:hypothetical protein [Acinetobacter sp. NIPH 1852]MCH7307811.1 hypothetical protein [Acinetobacter sp. NIPH 1852]
MSNLGFDLTVDSSVFKDSPRARARFFDANKKAKRFIKARNNYKAPDFGRMLLDLRNLNFSHEKIAMLLKVSGSTTVSAWATGTRPFFENGEQLIMLWQDQTGIERFPRVGEQLTYRYKFGQIDMFLDELDGVIDQLDQGITGRDGEGR